MKKAIKKVAKVKATPKKNEWQKVIDGVNKKVVKTKATPKKKSTKDYDKVPERIEQYRPIEDFDPKHPPISYIVVKMDRFLLETMLRDLTLHRAMEIGVSCKRVN